MFERTCPVCLEEVHPSEEIRLACGHAHHSGCVDELAIRQRTDMRCPVCRAPVEFAPPEEGTVRPALPMLLSRCYVVVTPGEYRIYVRGETMTADG